MQRIILKTSMILIAAMVLSLPDIRVSFGASFLELQPGSSTKSDVDRKLGAPIKEIIKGVQYDYPPQMDAARLSVTFYRETKIIKSIDIYSEAPYTKSEYQKWYQLGNPPTSKHDQKGHLIEFYSAKGIALYFAGPNDTSIVKSISHYDITEAKQTPPLDGPNDAQYYEKQADQALDRKDWHKAKKLIDEGLRLYPNFAELWHTRAGYYFRAKNEPAATRGNEALNSMYRAYKLNPSGEFAAEMGWLHKEIHNDCTLALSYFEEAEKKGYARERPGLLFWIGSCFEQIGMYFSASDYYNKFLKLVPQHKKRLEAERAVTRLREYRRYPSPTRGPAPSTVSPQGQNFDDYELN